MASFPILVKLLSLRNLCGYFLPHTPHVLLLASLLLEVPFFNVSFYLINSSKHF